MGVDRDRIRTLAEKATPGPWHCDPIHLHGYTEAWLTDGVVDLARLTNNASANAAYIAACSPDVILALLAERDALVEACRALVAWDDAEKAGPDYGTLTRDTHPQGEDIWRRWWDDQHALCRHAFDTARAALSRQHGETDNG